MQAATGAPALLCGSSFHAPENADMEMDITGCLAAVSASGLQREMAGKGGVKKVCTWEEEFSGRRQRGG